MSSHFSIKLIEVLDASMGPSRHRKVDAVVQIDPEKYNVFPCGRKAEAAGTGGQLPVFPVRR